MATTTTSTGPSWIERAFITILRGIWWLIKKTFFAIMVAVCFCIQVIGETAAAAGRRGREFFHRELRE